MLLSQVKIALCLRCLKTVMMSAISRLVRLTLVTSRKQYLTCLKHPPIKYKYLRANQTPFMATELHREIMKGQVCGNNFLGAKSQENNLKYNRQRNF